MEVNILADTITHDELKKIAGLAKLSLDGEDAGALIADISGIIEFAKAVSAADINSLDLTERDEEYPLREDALSPSLPASVILSNAPESRGGFFVTRGL
jgi:aspartyl/glutamyl-tRNA(Asn/Gln) amidotransferase C subunit